MLYPRRLGRRTAPFILRFSLQNLAVENLHTFHSSKPPISRTIMRIFMMMMIAANSCTYKGIGKDDGGEGRVWKKLGRGGGEC